MLLPMSGLTFLAGLGFNDCPYHLCFNFSRPIRLCFSLFRPNSNPNLKGNNPTRN